jgi:hypothetical protein
VSSGYGTRDKTAQAAARKAKIAREKISPQNDFKRGRRRKGFKEERGILRAVWRAAKTAV